METTPLIDLETIAKQLKLPVPGVQRAAELLEEGNTVPFITRFRKDQTGGLDEQQVRLIEEALNRAKLLSERKETILKSIESRGKLTDELAAAINQARTVSELEDVYLPYKPKKQSLASIARSRGLEPLATSIIEANELSVVIEERAAEFVDDSKGLPNTDAVIEGVKHLIAEHFGNHPKLRAQLRRHLWQTGTLVSKKIDQPTFEGETDKDEAGAVEDLSQQQGATLPDNVNEDALKSDTAQSDTAQSGTAQSDTAQSDTPQSDAPSAEEVTNIAPNSAAAALESDSEESTIPPKRPPELPTSSSESPAPRETPTDTDSAAPPETVADTELPKPAGTSASATAAPERAVKKKGKEDTASRRDQRRETRRRRRERLVQSFKDYFDFSDPIGRVPHHRILAINRGERTKVLRVKIECPDWDKVQAEAEAIARPADHPAVEFIGVCLHDAMSRLLQPSIEREVRRELTERAEEHAVKVFARNLRKLLLQPPLRQHRVVAIDPGFRSGCKLVALDEFGQMLGHTFINLLAKEQQKQDGRTGLAKFIQEHSATVVAVGNGAACRETEMLVAEVLSNELKDQNVGYLIVNEAGTSVYSTSDLGREELPNFDATVRSAVSIGRRSLDPLSELVKIDPASIGVGLYQHDVKAKHLRESLDAVVESCVNYVGVDVNSASPALLRYVSGLNSLTARRIYEHRQKNGPFKNREQLKEVSGIGESTYVQAAGFLKIVEGEISLDGTWIHPESYPIATKVLEAIGFSVNDLQVGGRDDSKPIMETQTITADSTPAGVEPVATLDETPPSSHPEITTDVSESEQQEASPPDTPNGKPARSAPTKELCEKLAAVTVDKLALELGVGRLLLKDILNALARPGRDPREDLPPPIFRTGILKLEDLKPSMELSGTVLNVVDFGAFVDIGLVDSGLIHVSRLADRFISDPHDFVSVGDILRVWVVDVDQKRRRVSLTAIEPGTEKPKPEKQQRKPRGKRKPSAETKEQSKPRKFARGKSHKPTKFKPKAPRKPVVPITKEMETGQEPMRTFGDLKQLFEKKKKGGSK